MSFSKSVFINCPFDDTFFPILQSILFTVLYLEFEPKIAETSNSGASRLHTIKDLIKKSKYSIHDISRVELNSSGLPRFNMPLECGIDFGFMLSGNKKFSQKRFLILEKEKFRYQKFMSDIAGNDIRAHHNNPELAIKNVRDWMKINVGHQVEWANAIWMAFNEFLFDYIEFAEQKKYDPYKIQSITFSDLIDYMKVWIKARKRVMS